MSGAALVVDAVTHRYGRRKPLALDGCTFTVPRGTICGLVGPNGAGKTTVFSVICGYLRPQSGRVDLLGMGSFQALRFKGKVGILPQDADLGSRHTPRELLVHLGMLQGLSWASARREAADKLAEVNLGERADDAIASLSHGMRRRVATASALVGDPELVLLDEPTAGLDPTQAASLRAVLAAQGDQRTLVISSHLLTELESLCDWVVMMDRGRVVASGTIEEVTGQAQLVQWRLAGDPPLAELRAALPSHVFSMDGGVLVQQAPLGEDLDAASVAVMGLLASHEVGVRAVQRGRGLERTFIEGTGR